MIISCRSFLLTQLELTAVQIAEQERRPDGAGSVVRGGGGTALCLGVWLEEVAGLVQGSDLHWLHQAGRQAGRRHGGKCRHWEGRRHRACQEGSQSDPRLQGPRQGGRRQEGDHAGGGSGRRQGGDHAAGPGELQICQVRQPTELHNPSYQDIAESLAGHSVRKREAWTFWSTTLGWPSLPGH